MKSYTEWSAAWKTLKDRKGTRRDIEDVIRMWREAPHLTWLRRKLPKPKFRKVSIRPGLVGEMAIEHLLFNRPSHRVTGGRGGTKVTLEPRYHNVAMSCAGRPKQVIADAMGVLRVGKTAHPVSIEVKESDRNCWAATVQCLQQVRMMRSNYEWLGSALGEPIQGCWGVVLAPRAYFCEPRLLSRAEELIYAFKDREARIILACSDGLSEGIIEIVGGYRKNWGG